MKATKKLARTLLSKKPNENAATVALLGVFVLAMLFAAAQNDAFGISRYLTADFDQVFVQHEFWRAFTSPLVHADVEHLGSNVLFFGGLAYLLNGYFGGWVFPAASFLAGGVINLGVLPTYPAGVTVLGASGIVYFMAAFWLTLYFAIERGISKWRRLTNAVAFSSVLLVPETLHVQVSYISHAVGFGTGIVFGGLFFALKHKTIRSHEIWTDVEPEICDAPDVECPLEITA